MKVYLEAGTNSRGIQRVVTALKKYLPEEHEIVSDIKYCDLVILHIYGRHSSAQKRVDWCKKHGKKYAMIQYCLKSTMRPNASDWSRMWDDAEVVWSYYDLEQICLDENAWLRSNYSAKFYHAPLGVDANIFGHQHIIIGNKYVVLASGQHALSESVRECAFATKAVGRDMIHLGHELRRGADIVCRTGLNDYELADLYANCDFVSGLRRCEGFELPVIEGALCGARPIVFDRPEMRHWFGTFAEFIPEGTREEVIESLKNVFSRGARPVTDKEKEYVRRKFNWETIINGFWEKL